MKQKTAKKQQQKNKQTKQKETEINSILHENGRVENFIHILSDIQ